MHFKLKKIIIYARMMIGDNMKKIEIIEKRKVPLKNYIILFFISVLTILLTIYINEWIKTYNENKLSTSPLFG